MYQVSSISQALPAKEGERAGIFYRGEGKGSPRIFPGLPVLSYLGQSSIEPVGTEHGTIEHLS